MTKIASFKPLKLQISLIPVSAMGENLRKEVGRSRWQNRVRAKCIQSGDGHCAICHGKDGNECHEKWAINDARHLMKLRGVEMICRKCHRCIHFGLSMKMADKWNLDIGDLIRHFMKVNGCTRRQFQSHHDHAFRLYRQRCTHQWRIDYGSFTPLVDEARLYRQYGRRGLNQMRRAAITKIMDAMRIELEKEGLLNP